MGDMEMALFPLRGVPAAVAGLLLACRAEGVTVNRTKIAKLLYFADLEAVKIMGRPQTGIPWVWLPYGPYHGILNVVERDLEAAGVITHEAEPLNIGVTEHRLRLTANTPQVDIDAEFALILARVAADYGHLAATTLRDLSYETPPMLEAQREGARGAALDLLGGTPAPRLGGVLERMQAVLNSSPIHEERGDRRELLTEMDDWAPGRRTANEALGD